MRRQRGICGKHYELRASNDSQLIQATNQSHIIGKPQSITNDATVNYLRALTKIDSTLDVTALTKLRALTQPATPRHNDGLDNINYDLILSYDEVLTGDAVYGKSGKYRVVSLLGQGSFGQVFKCREEETGELVAVKILRNRSPYFRQGMLEIAVLTLLKEKFDVDGLGNTVKMISHFLCNNHVCIVFELLGINLYELMKQNNCRGFGVSVARSFLSQMLKSLEVLYNNSIIHCDLKPENVLLVDYTKNVKLIDFGSACFLNAPLYTYIQSRHYRAPEIILGASYTSAIDMWSFGCIAAEFFIGIPLFPGNSEYNQLQKIIKMIGPPPNEFLEASSKLSKYFIRRTGANNKTVYELKKKSVFERENDLVLEANREYFDYQSLTDFVSRVPLRVNSREEHRTTEYRRAFSDFLRKILVWNPSQRLTPSQAICHPFITKTTFTPPVNLPDAIPPPLVHPPGSLTTPDEVLRYLFPTAHSDQLRVAPLHNNIILSILHQNPFAIPPITPASLEIWADKHSLKVNKSAPRTASTTNVPDGKGQEKEKNTKNTYSTR
ncbi:Homeodomain-interacting protein kinase [Entamoeba marina]